MVNVLVDLPDDDMGGDPLGNRVREIIAAVNGYAGQGFRFNLTEYTHDEKHGLAVRNRGADGFHQAWYRSDADVESDAPIVEVQDAGLFVADTAFVVYDGADPIITIDATGIVVETGYGMAVDDLVVDGTLTVSTLTTTNLTLPGNLIVQGNTTLGNAGGDTTTVSGALSAASVTAAQLQSTITTGTAPLIVASSTKVTNLNADLLDDLTSTDFARLGAASNFTTAPTINSNTIWHSGNDGSGSGLDAATLETLPASSFALAHSHPYLSSSGGTLSGALTISTGGLTVSAGGLTVSAGGATVTGGLTVSTGQTTVGSIDINGDLEHDGTFLGLFGTAPTTIQTVTGSRGGNAALASLLTKLATYGLIIDSSS